MNHYGYLEWKTTRHGLPQPLLMKELRLKELTCPAQGHQAHQHLTNWKAEKNTIKSEVAQNYHLHNLVSHRIPSSIICLPARENYTLQEECGYNSFPLNRNREEIYYGREQSSLQISLGLPEEAERSENSCWSSLHKSQ